MSDIGDKQLLIGCGILKKEINWLIATNNWQLNTFFIDSSLHIDFEKLHKSLTREIKKHSGHDCIVFYGACHPLMNTILDKACLTRTNGQNCVEMLLGHDLFTEELTKGAYFLLEDWALRWDLIISKTFGNNLEITKQIFQEDRKYLLALNTPCSGDFTKEAELAAQKIGLPLKWMDVGLVNLKLVLLSAINQKDR
jgi:hypothetical protein